jgi:DNA-binding transcriptional LysR family regulator
MVLNGEVDVAVTTIAPAHPEIMRRAHRSEEIIAVVSAKHALASKKRLTESELAKVPFIMNTEGHITDRNQETGFAPQCSDVVRIHRSNKDRCPGGPGCRALLSRQCRSGLRQGYFKALEMPMLKDIKIACYVIYRKGIRLSPNLLSFLSLIRRSSKA